MLQLGTARIDDSSLHGVGDQEEALADETIRRLLKYPSRNNSVLIAIHLGTDHHTLGSAVLDISVELWLYTSDFVSIFRVSKIFVELREGASVATG